MTNQNRKRFAPLIGLTKLTSRTSSVSPIKVPISAFYVSCKIKVWIVVHWQGEGLTLSETFLIFPHWQSNKPHRHTNKPHRIVNMAYRRTNKPIGFSNKPHRTDSIACRRTNKPHRHTNKGHQNSNKQQVFYLVSARWKLNDNQNNIYSWPNFAMN